MILQKTGKYINQNIHKLNFKQMKNTINNDLRVYQVVTSTMKQAFCNIEDLNEVVKELDCRAGYFTIYHFWNNKPKKVSKKDLKSFFEGANLKQDFYY